MSDTTLNVLVYVIGGLALVTSFIAVLAVNRRVGWLVVVAILLFSGTLASLIELDNRRDAEDKADLERVETKYDINIKKMAYPNDEPGNWLIDSQWRECYTPGGIETRSPVLMCEANTDGYAELSVGGQYTEGAR